MKTKGITTKKNTKGEITHVTVDVRQQPELKEHFTKIGVVEETEREAFYRRFNDPTNCTVEEARIECIEYLRSLMNQ